MGSTSIRDCFSSCSRRLFRKTLCRQVPPQYLDVFCLAS